MAVVRIKPIPRRLLTDTIVYQPFVENDGWNDAFGEEQTINNVRKEPVSSINRTSNSEGQQANDVVFIDRVNSSYFPVNAKAKDRIDGREVVRVKVLKALDSEPHHLEIELI